MDDKTLKEEPAVSTFTGSDTEDVTLFCQEIQMAAFEEDRQRDDAWIADYAGALLTGVALRWYITLDQDVQCSWKKLRVSMLERFDPNSENPIATSPGGRVHVSPSPSMSMSVGSAHSPGFFPNHHRAVFGNVPVLPGPVSPDPGTVRQAMTGTSAAINSLVSTNSRRGYIKLVKATDGHAVGYVSGFASDPWNAITPFQYEALTVEMPSLPPTDGSPWEMKIVNRPGLATTNDTTALAVFGHPTQRNPDHASWSFRRFSTDVSELGNEGASNVWMLRDYGIGGQELVILWKYTVGSSTADTLKVVKTSGIKSTTLSLRARGYTNSRNETVMRMIFEDIPKVEPKALRGIESHALAMAM
ncbi:hypothetical protein FRB97_005871 [Tulasnella sp. 331]|nr:hypothetical protein FRB97_005871 [Tulasnella sp. 331]